MESSQKTQDKSSFFLRVPPRLVWYLRENPLSYTTLFAIGHYARWDTKRKKAYCSVSQRQIQELLGGNRDDISRRVQFLVGKGALVIEHVGAYRNDATMYSLPWADDRELLADGSKIPCPDVATAEEPIPHNIEAPTREAPVKKTAAMPVLHEPKRVVDPVEQLISESWHGLTVLMDQFYAAVPRSEVASDAALRIKLREYIIATRNRFMLRDISSDELTREVLIEALAESITVHAFACNRDDRIKAPTSLLLSHVLPAGISPQSAMLR